MQNPQRIIATVILLAASAVVAHGGGKHLKGVVSKVEENVLTVAIEKGEPAVVVTDPKTEFTRGSAKVTLKDVLVGDRAVVHATEHEGKLVAHVVKLGPLSKPTSPDAGTARTPDHDHDHHQD